MIFGILVNQQGELLLTQRRRPVQGVPAWSLPSTEVRAIDTEETAIRHEFLSTLGIRVDPYSAERLEATDDEGFICGVFVFAGWRGRIVNLDNANCSSIRWFEPSNLPTLARVTARVLAIYRAHLAEG